MTKLQQKPGLELSKKDFVLGKDKKFEIAIHNTSKSTDLSLVIDVYDLDNPVHPHGHIGWWRFPLDNNKTSVNALLELKDGSINCCLDNIQLTDSWYNDELVDTKNLSVNVVLRSNLNNTILAIARLPTFYETSGLSNFRNTLIETSKDHPIALLIF